MSTKKLPIASDGSAAFARTVLGNGVRVVTETIPSVRSTSVGAWVMAGSRDEPARLSGISHLIEHMVFKGTRRRRMHHIAQRLESVGGYLDAFTGKEYTCYYARALDEHTDRALDTVCDLILSPSFPEKALDKEKDVVLEEMKMYDDAPEDLIFDHFDSVAYHGHALARPVIGYPDTVRGIQRSDLISFVEEAYAPNRVVVAVAGNVTHERVVELVERAFADSRRPNKAPRRRRAAKYKPADRTAVKPISQAHLVVGTRGPGARDAGRVPLVVLNTILGGGMSSRLNQNIRERYGYCYHIYSFLNFHTDSGDVGVYMGTDAAKVDRARKLILTELDRLCQKEVSHRTLSRAKTQVKGSIMLGLEAMSNRMMRLGRQELIYEQYFTLDQVMDEVDAVTAEDVREVACSVLGPDRLSIVVLRPTA